MTRGRHIGLISTLLTRLLATLLLAACLLAACAETTYEGRSEETSTTTIGVTTGPETTVVPAARDLLSRLATEAEGLSALMIEGGGEQEAAAVDRVEALWGSARQEVAASRPELVADFEANIARCANAVRFKRAADADKAAANLRALADAFLASRAREL